MCATPCGHLGKDAPLRSISLPASSPSVVTTVCAGPVHRVVLAGSSARGTITDHLLDELHAVLDRACADTECRVLVLAGRDGVFCTGMDLSEATARRDPPNHVAGGERFFDLMLRFTLSSLTIVAAVDGRATGGGVGLAAACDFVVATPRSEFALPEALWGLLPCCALPFLARRIGFQRAYAMSLSTLPVSASRGREIGLVDEVADDLELPLQPLVARSMKLRRETVAALKRHASTHSPITDAMRRAAVSELADLLDSGTVRETLARYERDRRFPWEPDRPAAKASHGDAARSNRPQQNAQT